MDSLSKMLVLGGTLVNLGDLDQDVLKRVLDAHVAGTGHPMPGEGMAVGNEVIVIPDEGDEHEAVNEEGFPGMKRSYLGPRRSQDL